MQTFCKYIPLGINIIASSLGAVKTDYYILVLSPIFHLLAIYNSPVCYEGHCKNIDAEEVCQKCGLNKWLRMRHCHTCNICVHKYDHHCYLLGYCVGQFNHKYYLFFLWFHLLNCIILIKYLLRIINDEVSVDINYIEHITYTYLIESFFIMFLTLNILICSYLACLHLYLVLSNKTTYEYYKGQQLPYLRQYQDPFDMGIIKNLIQTFSVSSKNPIKWQDYIKKKNENEIF